MHTELSLLEIVFRLSIFSLLAYKIYSLSCQYLIPFLLEQIAAQRKYQAELMEKEKMLVANQHRLKGQIYNQKQMFTFLERNVQVWHNTQEDENRKKERDALQTIEQLKEKRLQQTTNIALINNINLSIPQALDQARQTLTTAYKTNTGKELLHSVITRLPTQQKTYVKP